MRIQHIEVVEDADGVTLSACVRPDRATAWRRLWFRFNGLGDPLADVADVFAVAMLPFAMHEGEPCHIEGALSPGLESNLENAQQVLDGWYDFMTPVAVTSEGDRAVSPAAPGPGVACCFSGGVDSWYSLLSHVDRISHLLLIRGFDIGLDNDPLWRSACGAAEEIGSALDKKVITCETNLRQVADKGRADWGRPFEGDFWGKCLHGAALAATALALGRGIGELIVPATHTLSQLKPWGSSPTLDRYWSNDAVAITHDACDADRAEKVRLVARSRLALATLRVCHNDVAATNCGRCEKCLRTMAALRLAGVLDHARTFPDPKALSRLARLEVPSHLMHHYSTLLVAARRAGDLELQRMIEVIMGRRFSAERSLALGVRRFRRAGLIPPALRRGDASGADAGDARRQVESHARRR